MKYSFTTFLNTLRRENYVLCFIFYVLCFNLLLFANIYSTIVITAIDILYNFIVFIMSSSDDIKYPLIENSIMTLLPSPNNCEDKQEPQKEEMFEEMYDRAYKEFIKPCVTLISEGKPWNCWSLRDFSKYYSMIHSFSLWKITHESFEGEYDQFVLEALFALCEEFMNVMSDILRPCIIDQSEYEHDSNISRIKIWNQEWKKFQQFVIFGNKCLSQLFLSCQSRCGFNKVKFIERFPYFKVYCEDEHLFLMKNDSFNKCAYHSFKKLILEDHEAWLSKELPELHFPEVDMLILETKYVTSALEAVGCLTDKMVKKLNL